MYYVAYRTTVVIYVRPSVLRFVSELRAISLCIRLRNVSLSYLMLSNPEQVHYLELLGESKDQTIDNLQGEVLQLKTALKNLNVEYQVCGYNYAHLYF